MKWEDYEDFEEKYTPTKNLEAVVSFANIMSYFNSMGYLVKTGELDINTIGSTMSSPIIPVCART